MGRLTVLQSFPTPRPTTNPYLVLLADALRSDPEVEVLNFSWRNALLSRYDVFHVHWPEIMVTGGKWHKRAVRQLLFVGLLARLRLQRIAVVRTKHNIELPDGLSKLQEQLLRLFEKNTDLLIRLTNETPVDKPSVTIPHGHYRDWYGKQAQSPSIPGRIGYAGLIRRYKGVESLVEAFSAMTDQSLTLVLGGNPSSEALQTHLNDAAQADPRIILNLSFLSDAQFVDTITSSELMAFPYRFMHNSGGVLAALSLDRPVLVPDNAVNRALAEEVGSGWIHFFTAPMTADHIETALTSLRSAKITSTPDLSDREWDDAAQAHKSAYKQALRIGRKEKVVLS